MGSQRTYEIPRRCVGLHGKGKGLTAIADALGRVTHERVARTEGGEAALRLPRPLWDRRGKRLPRVGGPGVVTGSGI
jgi:hypothetical protein